VDVWAGKAQARLEAAAREAEVASFRGFCEVVSDWLENSALTWVVPGLL